MNKDDIIRMAREAGVTTSLFVVDGKDSDYFRLFERFAALVAAAVEERLKWDGLHSCHSECDRPACVHTRKAVEAEREACAQIAFNSATYIEAAKAIRARGQE